MNRITRAGVALGALVGAAHAHAGVIITCDATAEVRFVNVQELTDGAPFGREGLQFLHQTRTFSIVSGQPPEGFNGSVSLASDERGAYDGLLPRVGDGWMVGTGIALDLMAPGYGVNTNQSVLELTFLNLTDGASMYVLDVMIEWEMRFRIDRPDMMTDTAQLFGVGYGSERVGSELSAFEGPQVVSNVATPETVITHTSMLHLDVGRTPANPAGDVATIQLLFTMQGYVSSTVPSVGPAIVLGVGLVMLGARRGRAK